MLSKTNRLRSMRDFRHLYKKGKTQGSSFLALRFVKKDDQDYTRFAFVISNKTAKKAVDRNRVRRQTRAVIRENLKDIVSGYDVLITIKASYVPLPYSEKKEQVEYILKKSGLLKKQK